MPPSAWMLPDPDQADRDGVLGVGADLQPATLVDAYRRGIFPWPHERAPLPWFSPDPRGVLEPAAVHLSRSLRRRLRQCAWTISVDEAFGDVLAACATTRREEGTWITPDMARAYQRLHRLGWAHSIEVWDEHDDLVGGLYGVQLGGVFTGESMFHHVTDASKVALVALIDRLVEAGGHLLDVQLSTDHLRSLGARDWPRDRFLAVMAQVRDDDVRLRTTRSPAANLVDEPWRTREPTSGT